MHFFSYILICVFFLYQKQKHKFKFVVNDIDYYKFIYMPLAVAITPPPPPKKFRRSLLFRPPEHVHLRQLSVSSPRSVSSVRGLAGKQSVARSHLYSGGTHRPELLQR